MNESFNQPVFFSLPLSKHDSSNPSSDTFRRRPNVPPPIRRGRSDTHRSIRSGTSCTERASHTLALVVQGQCQSTSRAQPASQLARLQVHQQQTLKCTSNKCRAWKSLVACDLGLVGLTIIPKYYAAGCSTPDLNATGGIAP